MGREALKKWMPELEPEKGAVRPVDAMDAELGEKSFSEKVLHRGSDGEMLGLVSVE